MGLEARKFVPESYENNDSKAKDIFLSFIDGKGHTIVNDEEDYMHDVVTEKRGRTYYFELEMKRSVSFTTRESFKYDTVSFLGRKERLHKAHPFYYIIISPDTGYALTQHSDLIYKPEYKKHIRCNTSNRTGNDIVYWVPKEKCKFFKIA
jgi:hypothetical protein